MSDYSRQARYRASGRQYNFVLRDPQSIKHLESLSAKHGGITAAITHLLNPTERPSRPRLQERNLTAFLDGQD